MILISHRGNINGSIPERENSPEYIKEALFNGFDVEIDVWFVDNCFFLGHDNPKYKINVDFLENKKLWCHAKNIFALEKMLQNKNIHCFWHQNDDFTLTSNGFIWTYPNKKLVNISIAVLPELFKDWNVNNSLGVCSDFVIKYKKY
jgi:hypothetical protein